MLGRIEEIASGNAKEMMKAGFAPAFLNQPPQEERLPGIADHPDWLAQLRIVGAVPAWFTIAAPAGLV
jgi:hypothetical protein